MTFEGVLSIFRRSIRGQIFKITHFRAIFFTISAVNTPKFYPTEVYNTLFERELRVECYLRPVRVLLCQYDVIMGDSKEIKRSKFIILAKRRYIFSSYCGYIVYISIYSTSDSSLKVIESELSHCDI